MNQPSILATRHNPPSPFGVAPALDLNGWRFGVLISTHTNIHQGFFIDPKAIASLCAMGNGFIFNELISTAREESKSALLNIELDQDIRTAPKAPKRAL